MSVRTFRTSDPPARAQQIVDRMTLLDGMRAPALPPFVDARRTGPGRFAGQGPCGTRVDARVTVRPDGRGGSFVTERFEARSNLPFAATFAELVHTVATSHADAYERASRRR